jgi:hypothetical protein
MALESVVCFEGINRRMLLSHLKKQDIVTAVGGGFRVKEGNNASEHK